MDRREPTPIPLPSHDGGRVTVAEAIAAAATAGIALRQLYPHSSWLVDARGTPVFWWIAGATLYLRFYPAKEQSDGDRQRTPA